MALILDRPLRRVLGIGRTTTVRVSLDGPRLIVEPIRDGLIPEAPQARAVLTSFKARKAAGLKALDELVGTWGLDDKRMKLLGFERSPQLFREFLQHAADDLALQPAFDRLPVCHVQAVI